MSYELLALVVLLAFAGAWVWRGVFDAWRAIRHPQRLVVRGPGWEVSMTTSTAAAPATVTSPIEDEPDRAPRLRAVESP